MEENNQKKIYLTPAMRTQIKLEILRKVKNNPEYEKELIRKMNKKNHIK